MYKLLVSAVLSCHGESSSYIHTSEVLFVCLDFSSHTIFSFIWIPLHYWQRALNFSLHSTLIAIESDRLYGHFLRSCNTHTRCRALGCGSFFHCFNDFGISWQGFEHLIFYMRSERSNWLHHRRGLHLKRVVLCSYRHISYKNIHDSNKIPTNLNGHLRL